MNLLFFESKMIGIEVEKKYGRSKKTIQSRNSIRKYLNKPVKKQDIEDIFRIARKSPSGCNTQPGFAYILEGKVKKELSQKIQDSYFATDLGKNHQSQTEYEYFPKSLPQPYEKTKMGFRFSTLWLT